MRLEVQRRRILILPEQHGRSEKELDVAYIEAVLGLRKDGDTAVVRRVNAYNLSCLAYLEIEASAKGEGERE